MVDWRPPLPGQAGQAGITGEASASVADMFAEAVRQFQAGRLIPAGRLCRKIIALQPQHAAAFHLLSAIARQAGRWDTACDMMAKAVALAPAEPRYHTELGELLCRCGKAADAITCYDQAVALQPDVADAMVKRGNALFDLRRPAEALASYDQALAVAPGDAAVLNNRGIMLRELGRPEEALASYDLAVAAQPGRIDALINRGTVLRDLGRRYEALASYDEALTRQPDSAAALNNRANLLCDLSQFEQAVAAYDQAIALKPDYVEALINRGDALRVLMRLREALASYDSALALQPGSFEAHSHRGCALRDLGRGAEALATFDRALALRPHASTGWINRGDALSDLGRTAEALASYDRAIAEDVSCAQAYSHKATLLFELGEVEQATRLSEQALDLDPRRTRSYYDLAKGKRFALGDRHLLAMQALAPEAAALHVEQQIYLQFALARALADTGQHEPAFQHLLEGNRLKRSRTVYNEAATLAALERTRAAFSPAIVQRPHIGDPSATPVFILGMPRSGSTLVEQILASHPNVFAAGEIDDFERELALAAAAMRAAPGAGSPIGLSDQGLRDLGAAYVARVTRQAPAVSRIVDKNPTNFRLIGLIHLALPNARIIHTRRDPLDTCLSCFEHLFQSLPFTYELGELGRYYRHYDALMAHWRAVLPPGVMLEVQYEELVADLASHAPRIIAHCGLPWNASCLEFHKTPRRVRTSSTAQVRQPVYQASVGRAQAVARFLGPLLAELRLPAPVTR